MGRIQKMKMERAKRAFKEELFPTDKARAFYVDHAGNAMGFTIERADGHVLSYNGDSGRYEPFNVLPEDGAVNMPPYAYKDGKIVDLLSQDPVKNIQKYTCFYAAYFCGDFDSVITEAEYRHLEETGDLYRGDTMNYAPIFDGKIYPDLAGSSSAQIGLFGYHYDDDRRTVPSKAEVAAAGLNLSLNTKIGYLYRDADNNTVWNECVIEGTLTQEQKQKILDARSDGGWFIPKLVGLPEERLGAWDDRADHPFFELARDCFQETFLPPTVPVKAEDLVAAFTRCKEALWDEGLIEPSSRSLDDIISDAEKRKTRPVGPGGPGDVEKAKDLPKRETSPSR